LSNGEVFLFTLHHNKGITFQRNGCMRGIEKVQARVSPSDNRIWVRHEKHEECHLRKLIETNGRSFKLRFGIGASRLSHDTESWSGDGAKVALGPRAGPRARARGSIDGIDGPKLLKMAFICQQCKQPLQVEVYSACSLYISFSTPPSSLMPLSWILLPPRMT
jgi:hypothetical protein